MRQLDAEQSKFRMGRHAPNENILWASVIHCRERPADSVRDFAERCAIVMQTPFRVGCIREFDDR
jgi:hypothetical protein